MDKLNKKLYFLILAIIYVGSVSLALHGAFVGRVMKRIGQGLVDQRGSSSFWTRFHLPELGGFLGGAGFYFGSKELYKRQSKEYRRSKENQERRNKYLVTGLQREDLPEKIVGLNDCIKHIYQKQVQNISPSQRMKIAVNSLFFDKYYRTVLSNPDDHSGTQVIKAAINSLRNNLDIVQSMIDDSNDGEFFGDDNKSQAKKAVQDMGKILNDLQKQLYYHDKVRGKLVEPKNSTDFSNDLKAVVDDTKKLLPREETAPRCGSEES